MAHISSVAILETNLALEISKTATTGTITASGTSCPTTKIKGSKIGGERIWSSTRGVVDRWWRKKKFLMVLNPCFMGKKKSLHLSYGKGLKFALND